MDDNDEILYCGTSTGDIAKVLTGYSSDVKESELKRAPCLVGCFGRLKIKKGKVKTTYIAECYRQGIVYLP